MDCQKPVMQALKVWREINKTRSDKGVGDLRGRFKRFAKEARGDLAFLYGKGANPFVLIHIIDTYLCWWGGYAIEAAKEDEQVRRTLSSHVYWNRCLKAVQHVESLLSKLRTCGWVRIAALLPPDKGDTGLMQISRHVIAADSATRGLARTIRALGLNEPGWELVRESNRELPRLRGTRKKGKQLGGRPKEADWGKCATVLHAYLTLITDGPHWVSVVRLLKSAGVAGFPDDIPAESRRPTSKDKETPRIYRRMYTDTVRKRVNRLREDPATSVHAEGVARGYNMFFGRDGMIELPT